MAESTVIENGCQVTSKKPVLCPQCQRQKHVFIFRAASGAQCIDCENSSNPLQVILESRLSEDFLLVQREENIRHFERELREFAHKRRLERKVRRTR